jgi:phosphomannomutase/phosphoglucomutase
MLKPTIFREYDIRGVADTELTSTGIEQLGQGLGTYFIRHSGKTINVGRDCRLSSTRLRDALVKGLLAAGCDVTDVGVVPTPVLYYSVQHLQADGAVMITGSHNPPDYNGFKSVCGGGAIYGEAIQQVRRSIEAGDFERGRGAERSGGAERRLDVVPSYVEDIVSRFQFTRRVKVVADAGNGTAGPVVHRIFERLNVEVAELFFEMDGYFPNHHPDPTQPENLEALRSAVRERGAEFGIAFDGDADRIGAVDENGNAVYGDMLMLIYGREILTRKPGATFIGEVKCSQTMYDELNRLGGHAIMYKTGHSLIKAKMKQEHAELAGEMSGHMFFADRYYGYDDALYAACRLIEIVANSGRPLSAQTADLPRTVSTPEIRVDCPDEIKFDVVARVAAAFRGKREAVDIDGVRVLFPQGWGLVRASNTQPVLVMRFEASDERLLADYRREMEAAVDESRAAFAV